MGNEDESRLGRRIEDPDFRTKEVWKDLFIRELVESTMFYPDSLSPTYQLNLPDPSTGNLDFSVITRAFRDRPLSLAHTIVVGVYRDGILAEYSAAVGQTDDEGDITVQVVHQTVRSENPIEFNAAVLGSLAINTIGSVERSRAGAK